MRDKYQIMAWDTGEILSTSDSVNQARRICRGFGHTDKVIGRWYEPIAYVAVKNDELNFAGQEVWGVVYNPQFRA